MIYLLQSLTEKDFSFERKNARGLPGKYEAILNILSISCIVII